MDLFHLSMFLKQSIHTGTVTVKVPYFICNSVYKISVDLYFTTYTRITLRKSRPHNSVDLK